MNSGLQTQTLNSQLKEIFLPFSSEAERRIRNSGGRFVYYTTAETAYRILSNHEIWMRSTLTMNDYMEVRHGTDCVLEAYSSAHGKALNAALDRCQPGLAEEVESMFRAWTPGFSGDTFVTCVSEHQNTEDEHGRLSMWRAYGGQSGVAIVLNGAVMFQDTNALAAYASPVAYMNASDVEQQFKRVAAGMEANFELLRSQERAALRSRAFQMLRYASICTKHPGFSEEREWRIVASPIIEASDRMPLEIEVVRGVPQAVLKIKLEDQPDRGLVGLALPQLIDRIIIGPTEYPVVIRRALFHLLELAAVPDPAKKIFNSGIPLRQP